MKDSIYLLFLGFILIGCAPRQLTPEESIAERERHIRMVTREYEGKTPQEILLAADRIFRLADDDYRVAHSETALQAQRNWMLYLVITAAFGIDSWIVETWPTEKGTKVIARHSGQSQGVAPIPTANLGGGMGVTAGTSPVMAGMSIYSGIYDLFYARLDYLLGQRADWVTCKGAKNYEGPLDPFCMVANDRSPDASSKEISKEP